MPIGYLTTVILLGLGTGGALSPGHLPGLIGYRAGFLLNEMPLIAAYWLTASTLLALSAGDLRTAGGHVTLALTALVLAGLGVLVWRGFAARHALRGVLPSALGPGRRAQAAPGPASRKPWPLVRALLLPVLRRRRDVERISDIAYGDAGRENLLDVYRHRSRPHGSPVLIHLHGGRFTAGAKNRESLPLLYRMASHGWLCISANYRKGPGASFPSPLIDVKKVLAWVRTDAAGYGADPAIVFVAGDSAGAWLAATAALTPNQPAYQPGFEQADTTVTAAICLYGYYGPTGSDHPEPSPLDRIHPDAPPFLIIHGDHDTVTPASAARQFAAQLQRTSAQLAAYAELPGAQHNFDYFHSVRCELTLNTIEDFTTHVRSKLTAHQPGPMVIAPANGQGAVLLAERGLRHRRARSNRH